MARKLNAVVWVGAKRDVTIRNSSGGISNLGTFKGTRKSNRVGSSSLNFKLKASRWRQNYRGYDESIIPNMKGRNASKWLFSDVEDKLRSTDGLGYIPNFFGGLKLLVALLLFIALARVLWQGESAVDTLDPWNTFLNVCHEVVDFGQSRNDIIEVFDTVTKFTEGTSESHRSNFGVINTISNLLSNSSVSKFFGYSVALSYTIILVAVKFFTFCYHILKIILFI